MKTRILASLVLTALVPPCAADFSVTLEPVATLAAPPYSVHDLAVVNDRAYMAVKNAGVVIMDVSNPQSPRLLTVANPGDSVVSYVTAVGSVVYAGGGGFGLDVYDAANAPSTTWITNIAHGANSLFAANGYLYVSGASSALMILDVSNPAAPNLVNSCFDLDSQLLPELYVQGDYVYATAGNVGLHIVNVANPASPITVNTTDTGCSAQVIFVRGRYAYIGGTSPYSFFAVDVADPAAPVVFPGAFGLLGRPESVQVTNGIAFVGGHNWGNSQGGIEVLDVGNPGQITKVGEARVDNYLSDMKVVGEYVYVSQAGDGLKVFRINYSGLVAPQFTRQPGSATVTAGQAASFSTIATGAPTAMLQWQRSTDGGASWRDLVEGAGFTGTDRTNLTIHPTAIGMNGHRFRVVAYSVAGTNCSAAAVLTVNGAPLVTAQPQSLRVGYGQTAAFSVVNLGASPFAYQWFLNGAPLAGQTDAALVLRPVTAANEGRYCVRISNDYGWTVSAEVSLTVNNIVAWGSNGSGQTNVPAELSGAVAIAAGGNHSLALRADGTMAAWGAGGAGQTNVPSGLVNVVGMTAGQESSTALRADGSVIAWGTDKNTQAVVPTGLSDLVAVSAGVDWTMGLRSDGTVTAWGPNAYGATNVPSGLSNVVGIAAGYTFGMALRSNGTIAAWGNNSFGEATVPAGLTNVVSIAAGWMHALALRADGTVKAWGWNEHRQRNVPAGLTNVVAIACGAAHSVALRADGTVAAWGYNSLGQATIPTGLSNVVMICCGDYHTIAIQGDPSRVVSRLQIERQPKGVQLSFPTVEGQRHVLEYSDSAIGSGWKSLAVVPGYGLGVRRTVVDTAMSSSRLYRTRTLGR
ncbi:MAG TPA: hypothetical protein P5205_05160 [Candidatus Paceibacterota bacterium]|nr:hypothetical protein [Verrucomicrobiota bacterium]HSA09743.1 hypothetical protein [Candidatus Paceibacterota bacterium]